MNEDSKHQPEPETTPQGEPDVIALIKKMQQHLIFLEKKIDILIGQSSQSSQSSERPFNKERRFSRPFRPGGHSPSHPRSDNRERHSSSSERGFSQNRRPFDGPRGGGESRGFGQSKKPFFSRRKSRG